MLLVPMESGPTWVRVSCRYQFFGQQADLIMPLPQAQLHPARSAKTVLSFSSEALAALHQNRARRTRSSAQTEEAASQSVIAQETDGQRWAA